MRLSALVQSVGRVLPRSPQIPHQLHLVLARMYAFVQNVVVVVGYFIHTEAKNKRFLQLRLIFYMDF
jgi:hypothetical protein